MMMVVVCGGLLTKLSRSGLIGYESRGFWGVAIVAVREVAQAQNELKMTFTD